MSLADELLADLEEDEPLDEDFQTDTQQDEFSQAESNLDSVQKQYSSVRNLATIIDSEELKRVMIEIDSRHNNDGIYLFRINDSKVNDLFIYYLSSYYQQVSN